jgi:hypothetical protein
MRKQVLGLAVISLVVLMVGLQGAAAEDVIFKSRDLSLGGADDYSVDWWLAKTAEGGVVLTAEVRLFAFAPPYYTGHVNWSKGAYPFWTEALSKGLEMIQAGSKEGPVASWPDDVLVISLLTRSNGQTYLVHKFKAFPPDKVRPLKLTPMDAQGVIKALESLP